MFAAVNVLNVRMIKEKNKIKTVIKKLKSARLREHLRLARFGFTDDRNHIVCVSVNFFFFFFLAKKKPRSHHLTLQHAQCVSESRG